MKMPANLKLWLQKALTPERYSRAITKLLPRKRAKSKKLCRQLLIGKKGIEIGGPSDIFKSDGLIPLYPNLGCLDNCNFSGSTTWEGVLVEGMNFCFDPRRPVGFQYIREAADLRGIESERYDFVLSSHMIEHLANPLRALHEWRRIISPNGFLVLVTPHYKGTFDHRRPVTTLEHLLEDYEQRVDEADLTHLEEVLELHDLERDPGSNGYQEFKERCLRNVEYRCIHHHVFDTEAVVQLLDKAGFELLAIEVLESYHIIATARNRVNGRCFDNSRFIGVSTGFRSKSHFVGGSL
jgi:SAM-dependent methyltransferase